MPEGNGFSNKEMLIIVMDDVKALKKDVADLKLRLEPMATANHESRIRSLERFRWSLPPTIFAAIAGIALQFIH